MSRSARAREAPTSGREEAGKSAIGAEGSLLTLEQSEREAPAAKILEALPNRIHEVIDRYVAATPDSVALIADGETLTYRQFDRAVTGTAKALQERGVRAGDRVLIVSENCISL